MNERYIDYLLIVNCYPKVVQIEDRNRVYARYTSCIQPVPNIKVNPRKSNQYSLRSINYSAFTRGGNSFPEKIPINP